MCVVRVCIPSTRSTLNGLGGHHGSIVNAPFCLAFIVDSLAGCVKTTGTHVRQPTHDPTRRTGWVNLCYAYLCILAITRTLHADVLDLCILLAINAMFWYEHGCDQLISHQSSVPRSSTIAFENGCCWERPLPEELFSLHERKRWISANYA